MLKTLLLGVAALAVAFMLVAPSKALAGAGIRMEARLSTPSRPGATNLFAGKAKYEETALRAGAVKQRFAVEVEKGTPGSVLPVTVNGSTVGRITINSLGRGALSITVGGDNPGSGGRFPRLTPGAKVQVGTAGGTLTLR